MMFHASSFKKQSPLMSQMISQLSKSLNLNSLKQFLNDVLSEYNDGYRFWSHLMYQNKLLSQSRINGKNRPTIIKDISALKSL